jgi:copper chaperone CopZ
MADKVELALNTTGMHCPSCAMLIEMTLKKEAGVEDVKADYPAGRTDVTYDPAITNEAAIVAKIEDLGYKASAK